ncbi:hypothetical protein O0I10_007140 [Lichtheimia ornata]|uniref:Zn(2)-C6 fungal-type domain-containing protein n=1 Tax=Lichtheimia ornata TaxID=688661 RepID=A0AAD7V204_9FUNG|nr:uncharacterized protein O0I10_007140 [Lichtheimia ornata]KAJ8657061.1 hypothetical protein O0I10_007140 [Lichtheimia ornata]
MQFIHSSQFYGGYNASQQQALQQQGQQGQQPQQPHSPHTSQSPATSSAAVDQQQQQPPQPQGLSLPVAALQSFAQANGIPVQAAPELNAQGKPKRKQVKNACVNCQKACKKCDDGRPCQRCIKYGLQDTCVNSVRKERKKGIKRGPYKKRKQADGGSTDGSAASTPATSLPAGLYAPTTQGSAAGVRTANGVLAYPSFQSGTYDAAFHAAAVSYQNSASMIPHAYMVPAAIQQMYPPNTMLSYQAAMNMLSPQHGQPSPNIYGYRPDAASSQQQQQQQQQQQAPQQQQEADAQSAQHRSHEGSPATPNGVGTPNSNPIKPETTTESDDEGSKLNILSQLCSAVLDRTPDTSNATTTTTTPAVSQASTTTTTTTTTTNAATTTTTTSPTTTSAPIKSEQVEEQKSDDQPLAANVKLETKDTTTSSPPKETTQETSNEEGDVVKKEE